MVNVFDFFLQSSPLYKNDFCINMVNDFFVQYQCLQSKEEAKVKWNKLSIISATICLIAVIIKLKLRQFKIQC